MQSTGTVEIDSNSRDILSIAFIEDGEQVLSGCSEGLLQRWQVDDGHEVGRAIQVDGAEIYATVLSPDRKRLVCGLGFPKGNNGRAYAAVWNAQTGEKLLDIPDHQGSVFSVDISPDSTKFVTGSNDKLVFIWNISTGERLVGPLPHDTAVVAVRFSPNGDRIATATPKLDSVNASSGPGPESIRIHNSENGEKLLEIPFAAPPWPSSPFAWSADGRQLFTVSQGEAKCFDTSSGAQLSEWSVQREGHSICLARNQKFMVLSGHNLLSFWDTSTHEQIGTVIEVSREIWSTALSSNDDCIATGEENGKIMLQSLRDTLPSSYFTVNLPVMYISDAAFDSWTHGDFTRVQDLLTGEIAHSSNPFHHARALAHRALVRTRSKQWNMAIDDAKKSIEVQRSVIGHIANAIAHAGNGEHDLAMRAFDLLFVIGLPGEYHFFLLIKAIILFECGQHDDAISRLNDLINVVDNNSIYITVQAQMYLILGNISMKEADNGRAIELFRRAQEAIPFRPSPHLVVISLIFGWDFDRLALTIQLHLYKAMYAMGDTEVVGPLSTMVETLGQKDLASEMTIDWDADLVQRCLAIFESDGDAAMQSKDPKEAIIRYSTALSLNPPSPGGLLVKRSKARATMGLWEDALRDADQAIKADREAPWGYERRHAALHGLQRYDEAMTAFTRMLSLIEESAEQDIRRLGKEYILPSRSEAAIESIIREVSKTCPFVLIDVKSGHLCDGPKRMHSFKSEPQFKELVSSMTQSLDETRIQRVVGKYFEFVMFSHVWGAKEPSFQDVNLVTSVWDLDSELLFNEKLRKFCEMVREDGYRWAWSDTCCIDKTNSTVLHQSLTMMYKWYEASVATLVLLASVVSPSALGDLTNSIWMTRAWTTQELLAPKVVRFYNRDWRPYLGDTRTNHKESPEIMHELANAIGISYETITAFNPDDLSVREKLRLASTRNATVDEDIAYSLIGIFKSDIRPNYGEGDAALGHLLEEIVTRLGEVSILAWTGNSSQYNSCLPRTLRVYSQKLDVSAVIEDAEMDARVAALRTLLPSDEAIAVHERITDLPPVRFANRRLYLPCIIFAVKRLGVQNLRSGRENRYGARVSGIGHVEFQTSDRLSVMEPRKLILVHPWIRDLRDPLDEFTWGSTSDSDDSEIESNPDSASSPLHGVPAAKKDGYTRALQLIVRMQQPFHALLLQQQSGGEFKRVAAEHEIVVSGLERNINFSKDIRVEVVQIL